MLPPEKKYYKYWFCISYIKIILEKKKMEKFKNICVYNISIFLISILMKRNKDWKANTYNRCMDFTECTGYLNSFSLLMPAR